MKRLIKKIMMFLPILGVMCVVNWQVDPGEIFSRDTSHLESQTVQAYLDGCNTSGFGGDIRRIRREWINRLDRVPGTVIIGSSRCWQVYREMVGDPTFLNLSMQAATIQDLVALVELLLRKGGYPEHIIIGIDPWTFTVGHGQVYWEALALEYEAGRDRLLYGKAAEIRAGEAKLTWWQRIATWKMYFELVSPSYFQSSLKAERFFNRLFHVRAASVSVHKVSDRSRPEVQDLYLADGSRIYGLKRAQRPQDEVAEIARTIGADENHYTIRDYRRMDEDAMKVFEAMLKEMSQSGCRITLFLPPLHPMTYRLAMARNSDGHHLNKVEAYTHQLGERWGIPVVGSIDPGHCGVDESDFVDALHVRRSTMKRLFRGYFPVLVESRIPSGTRPSLGD